MNRRRAAGAVSGVVFGAGFGVPFCAVFCAVFCAACCVVGCSGSSSSASSTSGAADRAGVEDVVRAPLVDPAAPYEEARHRAAAAVQAGDLDGALKLLDAALGGVVPVARPGVPSSVVARTRCDRAAVLSRRAAVVADLAARERDLRAGLLDCDDDERGPVLREALAHALVRRARALGDGAAVRRARRALYDESLALFPTAPAAVDLAVVCEADDDLPAALAAAEQAVALVPDGAPDKPRVVALRDRLKRYAHVEGDFKSASQRHFVARFEGPGEERLAWGVLDQLEKAWFTVGQRLDLYPDEPITVVVYTGDQYRQATATPDWSTGAFDGKIRIREGLLAAERGTLADTLVHEYVHAALFVGLPSATATSLPAWFNEGLAQSLEPSSADVDVVRLLAHTGKAPLSALQGRSFVALSKVEADAAYVTARAMVQTLLDRRGVYGVQQLVAGLRSGSAFDDALGTSFALTPAQLWALLP
ncbi:MAG: hypothetical protein FJ137_10275 [Deltaproteobacteria bacterium]|nr:hypothetical protein [Deltaproteobacteria bacterium]